MTVQAQTVTHWATLVVTDTEGQWCDLGTMVRDAPATLDSATIRDGMIAAWLDFFLAADGEEADWDTPRGPVDWSGFAAAVEQARRRRSADR